MGVAKDIHKICTDTYYDSSIYVIFYNLCIASHIVSPTGSVHLHYERLPFLEFNRKTCPRYCKTDYFTETYRPGLKHRREYQHVDRSVCEYYPIVIDCECGRLSVHCKQYMLKYEIYGAVMPALIYHKSYENYVLISAHMVSSACDSYVFRRFYRKNLFKFGAECDIVGKVVEDYVDYINSEKENYVSDISRYLESERKLTNNFRSKLEELRTTNTVVDGKLALGNIEEGAKLFNKLLEIAPRSNYSGVSKYSTDLLELVKIIRILGTSHDTAYGV